MTAHRSSAKPPKRPPGVELGDHVYMRHPKHGPMAVQVLACGKDGLTGQCDQGQRHQLPWDSYLGHKARMAQRCRVIDQGADGAIVEDESGRRRYVAGELPLHKDSPAPASETGGRDDDPLLGGLERLHKSEAFPMLHEFPEGPRILFLKAGAFANRAGLALKEVTDKAGHQTKRWTRTATDEPANDHAGPAPMKHGDVVAFRHQNVEGRGKIISSGVDGVTVQTEDGRQHQVRHEHLVPPGDAVANDSEPPATGKVEAAAKRGPDTAAGGSGAGGDGPGDGNPPPVFARSAVASLPDVATQPIKDREELYAKAGEALSHLKSWLDEGKGVCDQLGYQTMAKGMGGIDWDKPGGMLFIAPLKGEKRAAEKVEKDYKGDWSQLRDVVRCSIAVDTHDEVKDTLAALQKAGLELAQKPKDRFNQPLDVGYRDLMLIAKAPNGMCMEIQLHVKPMLKAKEEGHKHYEVQRSLEAKQPSAWTLDDRRAIKKAQAEQMRIYGEAWDKATGAAGAGEGETMSKALDAGDAGGDEPMEKGFSFFEKDGALFRRKNNGLSWSVDEVLHQGKWVPYQGDRLAPAMFGNKVSDPLAKGGADALEQNGTEEPMAKALGGKLVLIMKEP